ncbi:MAG: arsenate reductase (glutaredoxin) [Legionella sp.]|nr:arsenate reductase (glutaredoxin) [Legionella sp.]
MTTLTIYHNPRCSKSRKTLEILKQQGIEPLVIEYLKKPLNYEELLALRVHFSLKDLVRTNESRFSELALSLNDEKSILKAMTTEPKLMQRPIVTYKDKAVIGRPPEKVLDILV